MSSEQLDKLAAALAKAQGKMSNATLNKTNPHFKSRYADLAAIRDAVIGPLTSEGLAVVQLVGRDDAGAFLTTRLIHASGQWVESVHPLPQSAKPQEFGSALTYARRYSLAAICGISSDDDDDANSASTASMQTSRPPKVEVGAREWASKQMLAVKSLATIDDLIEWESQNDAALEKLRKIAPKLADDLDASIADMRAKLA